MTIGLIQAILLAVFASLLSMCLVWECLGTIHWSSLDCGLILLKVLILRCDKISYGIMVRPFKSFISPLVTPAELYLGGCSCHFLYWCSSRFVHANHTSQTKLNCSSCSPNRCGVMYHRGTGTFSLRTATMNFVLTHWLESR